MSLLLERIHQGEILVSDGATGTYLQANGLEPGGCPEAFTKSVTTRLLTFVAAMSAREIPGSHKLRKKSDDVVSKLFILNLIGAAASSKVVVSRTREARF